jgi:mannose-6-phosphate isomerase
MHIVTDIGGTNTRVAGVVGDTLGQVHKIQTPKSLLAGAKALAAVVQDVANGEHVDGLFGCIAGNVSESGALSDARNLPGWEGHNVVEALSREMNVPVSLMNDGGLVGLGEAVYGAGKNASSIVYVTVSTGVGGALIKEGKIVESGGIGRTEVDGVDLENSVSGTAVTKKFGIHPKDLDSLEEREKLARILGKGLARILAKWPADVVVVGGSMIVGMNPLPIETIQDELDKMRPASPEVRKAELGDNGGLYGGLAMFTQRRS